MAMPWDDTVAEALAKAKKRQCRCCVENILLREGAETVARSFEQDAAATRSAIDKLQQTIQRLVQEKHSLQRRLGERP